MIAIHFGYNGCPFRALEAGSCVSNVKYNNKKLVFPSNHAWEGCSSTLNGEDIIYWSKIMLKSTTRNSSNLHYIPYNVPPLSSKSFPKHQLSSPHQADTKLL